MDHRLEFQVLLLPNVPGEELLARFRYVEALGFDLVATADHFVDWRYPKPSPTDPWLEGWTTLAAAARETSHIKLATYVTQIPLRNPAMLARQALTVDQISAGRLVIGLGIGLTSDPSYGMMGLANWPLEERVARFGEYAEIIDLRSIVPLDSERICESVAKTGRLLVVDEDYRSFGLSGEIIARVVESLGPGALRQVARHTMPDLPLPASKPLEEAVMPGAGSIAGEMRRLATGA